MSRYNFRPSSRLPVAWTPKPTDAANDQDDRQEADRRYVEAVMAARATGFLHGRSHEAGGWLFKTGDFAPKRQRHL